MSLRLFVLSVSSEARGISDAMEGSTLETGLSCLVMLARFDELAADPDQIEHEFSENGTPPNRTQIQLAARTLGLSTRMILARLERLTSLPLPAMAFGSDENCFVLARCDGLQDACVCSSTTRWRFGRSC